MIARDVLVQVPSLTGAGRAWTVVLRGTPFKDGELWVCDCPAWPKAKDCKHVELAKAASRLLDKCQQQHGTNSGTLCARCLVAVLALAKRKTARNYEPKGTGGAAQTRALRRMLATKKLARSKDPVGDMTRWLEARDDGSKQTTTATPTKDGQ